MREYVFVGVSTDARHVSKAKENSVASLLSRVSARGEEKANSALNKGSARSGGEPPGRLIIKGWDIGSLSRPCKLLAYKGGLDRRVTLIRAKTNLRAGGDHCAESG
jgi:hypothetical protein